MPNPRLRLATAALLVLGGCKEAKHDAPHEAAAYDGVRQAAERNIRASLPGQAQFRGVQAYAQAMPRLVAICGQTSPFADNPALFVPFVSIVTLPEAGSAAYQFDQSIGTTPAEATRVYQALLNHCYDKGGPAPGTVHSVPPLAPLPDIPAPTAAKPATRAEASATSTSPSSGSVTMRQNANLHAEPHGPALRTLTQGTKLRIFGQAAGGWYQVGDTAPLGWVHESMLSKP